MNQSGFSLVELSIVLVILGLLTGGILTGQSLIRAAELRAITTEFANIQTAIRTFQGKYFALPGDMNNAEAFWGTMATGTCPNATAGTGTQTCNGNGQITAGATASQSGEPFTFWQQLANAGLIEGSYTGIAGPNTSKPGRGSVIGENVPASKMSGVGYYVEYQTGGSYGIANVNYVYVGTSPEGQPTWSPFLKPEEAWGIDKKVDDGRPGFGRMITSSSEVNCVTSATAAMAEYRLKNTTESCNLYIIPGI
jgi:prepilin-type N-terminal cleavage/methylation domain-containing protein